MSNNSAPMELKYHWQNQVKSQVRSLVHQAVGRHYPGAQPSDGVVRHLVESGRLTTRDGLSKKTYAALRSALLISPARN